MKPGHGLCRHHEEGGRKDTSQFFPPAHGVLLMALYLESLLRQREGGVILYTISWVTASISEDDSGIYRDTHCWVLPGDPMWNCLSEDRKLHGGAALSAGCPLPWFTMQCAPVAGPP